MADNTDRVPKYWIGNSPSSNSVVTEAEADDLAQFASDLSTGVVDANDGVASPENAAKATKTMAVSINGTTYYIPLYEDNVAA